jgi:hypothetical protein
MEADRLSDELLLNALVDGELSPADHAAAAARLANDREFAGAYATLTRLKAGIADYADDCEGAEIELDAPVSRRRYTAAAGVTAVLAAGIAAFVLAAVLMPSPELQNTAKSPVADVVSVAFAVDPVIPDLSPAGLQLARTVLSAAAGGQALVATYVGPRGCRLELWVSNASMSAKASGGTERRRWQVNGLIYELIAFGMPAARFEKVANAAEKATRATVLPDEADRQLIEARVSTTPCLA